MTFFSRNFNDLDMLLHRRRPSPWERFLARPCVFLAQMFYTRRQRVPSQPLVDPVSVVCVSDTHNSQPKLPEGDVLIHAGDLTQSGTLAELQAQLRWLGAQPHAIKVVMAGNHDMLLDPACDGQRHDKASDVAAERQAVDWGDIIYLENAATTVTCTNGRQLCIYGSPWSPRLGRWAFQYPRGENVWTGTVPQGVDILVTHGPPKAHLDLQGIGCEHLLSELWRVRPRLHIFGHVHEGSGTEWLQFDGLQAMYERTVRDRGGVWNLLCVTMEFVRSMLRPAVEAKCLLVNAAIVGGLREEERRRPIKVVI
ncbi:hypothetical protein VTJ83DRAFT_4830 [Remersonia thermophila]|uniref:Calcineurin-like phosphoesterase domain-containing protein n=1 Tax=Remersonia thermophila TaxID=72144 RepID=A0ABR4DB41_9PEZI